MAGIHLHQITQPGQHAAGVGFEQPFEMLTACHERVHRMLRLLGKLREHLATRGHDEQAAQAARDVMRYFDQAAPLHHEDAPPAPDAGGSRNPRLSATRAPSPVRHRAR